MPTRINRSNRRNMSTKRKGRVPVSTSKVRRIARNQAFSTKETKKQTITVTDSNITTVNSSPTTDCWRLAQGDTSVTREGNEIYATSFCHKFILTADEGSSNNQLIRIVLYMPRHDKDDTINNLSVISSVDTDKFKVMYDRVFPLGYGSGHSEGVKYLQIKRKFRNPKKLYYSGSGLVDPISPVMKYVFVSDAPVVGGKPPHLQAELINYYKD